MSRIRRKYDEVFKKNAVRLSYARNRSVAKVAKELGISLGTLYRWRQKYMPEGDKTRQATLEEENKALHLELAELLLRPPQMIYAFIFPVHLRC